MNIVEAFALLKTKADQNSYVIWDKIIQKVGGLKKVGGGLKPTKKRFNW